MRIRSSLLKRILCIVAFGVGLLPLQAQKLITYEAGMGTRDPENADVWILYKRVRAEHEGMVLHADSALLNTVHNDFTAYGRIRIEITDTTTIFGDRLFYDGNSRVVDIWADTVRLVDGKTVLKTNHLSYDRNTATATYNNWGRTVNEDKCLVSRIGHYNSETKKVFIYVGVVLNDSNMRMETDTLIYDMNSHVADFWSPTHIYTDSAVMYSELGSYNTDLQYAHSVKSSQVRNGEKVLTCDTLHYYEATEFGRAIGHVVLEDTVNDITCMGRYGETDQAHHTSFVTDSALVIFVSRDVSGDSLRRRPVVPDTLYLHADSVLVRNDSARRFVSVMAHHHVKVFRRDAQAMCDSAFYSVPDSLLQMYYNPVLWYEGYQCAADTIEILHNAAGVHRAYLRTNCFNVEQLDAEKYNQIKGRNGIVYFTAEGEPDYADVIGNAEMVYYITEDDEAGRTYLVGVNVGIGSDMRIYFKDRAPARVVTMGKPDMRTYPYDQLEPEKRQLSNFRWLEERRPHSPQDVFRW